MFNYFNKGGFKADLKFLTKQAFHVVLCGLFLMGLGIVAKLLCKAFLLGWRLV